MLQNLAADLGPVLALLFNTPLLKQVWVKITFLIAHNLLFKFRFKLPFVGWQ